MNKKMNSFGFLILLCLLLLPFTAMAGMAAESGTVTIVHANDSTSSGSSLSDSDLANKIYSDDTIFGFKMGSGKISDIVSIERCMGVISANPLVFAIISVVFVIGIAIAALGFFWSTIMHIIKIIFASQDSNADRAIEKMHQHRKGIVYLAESVGVGLIILSVGMFGLTFIGG